MTEDDAEPGTLGVDRARPDYSSLDLVGPVEIASRLGMRRGTVAVWKSRGKLPEPLAVVSGVPVWDWPQIHEHLTWSSPAPRRVAGSAQTDP